MVLITKWLNLCLGTSLIIDPDFDTFAAEPSEKDDIKVENNFVFAFGSMGLTRIARERNWFSGKFENSNFDFEIWSNEYGKENILNPESLVIPLGDSFGLKYDSFFARPCKDDKSFNGQVFLKSNFEHWRDRILEVTDSSDKLNKDTLITIAPLKEIYSECRVMVVTYSRH